MNNTYEIRHAAHPLDVKKYDTERLREEFLVQNLMSNGQIKIVYSEYDRYIVGGAIPITPIKLETIDPLKSNYFLERRELGLINVGGTGLVKVDGKEFNLKFKEAIYIGRGNKEIIFESINRNDPDRKSVV